MDQQVTRAYEDFVALFQGEESLKTNYPATYENLQSLKDGAPTIESNTGDISLKLLSVRYTADKKYIDVVAEMCASKSFYNKLTVTAKEKNTAKEIARAESSEFIGNMATVKLSVPATHRNDCLIELLGCEVSPASRILRAVEDLSKLGVDPAFTVNYTVEHPQRTKTTGDMIIAAYGTRSAATSDYYYASWSGNFKLPSKGNALLTGRNFKSVKQAYLAVINASNISEAHTLPTGYSYAGNKLEWNFREDWGFDLTAFLGYSSQLRYELVFVCELVEEQDVDYYFVVTNRNDIEGPLVKKIPMIAAYRDCLAAGTRISLSDGTQIPIEQIREGQLIADGAGKSTAVQSIMTGVHTGELIHVTADDGRAIKLSQWHEMLTETGYFPACELRPGMVVLMGGEGRVAVKSVRSIDGDGVQLYNLMLSKGGMVADGFIVRGVTEESMKPLTIEAVRRRIPEKWRKDFDSLQRR